MNVDSPLVDQIVANVMAVLANRSENVPTSQTSGQSSSSPVPQPTSPKPSQDKRTVLTERVITAELLKGRVSGQREVTIATRSVLTPSARDFLKAKRISWCRQETDSPEAASSARWFVIPVQPTSAVTRFVEEMQRNGVVKCASELVGTAEKAASLGISALSGPDTDAVVVFAESAELVACLANRNEEIRAAAVHGINPIDAIRHTLSPNFWAINAAGKSYFYLKNLWKKLASGAA